MKHILVIGSMNMDLIIHTDRYPKIGETLAGYGFSSSAGGKGANQAAAAAKLGADVRFIACCGNDTNGDILIKALKDLGVDCSCVLRSDSPTGTAMITVVNGDNCIIIDHGANFMLTPGIINSEMFTEAFRWADIVILQLEIPLESVEAAAARAKQNNAEVFLNPAPAENRLGDSILRNVDYIIPNEHEAAAIAGCELTSEELTKKAAEDIFSRYGCKVIITLGENGSLYYDGEKYHRQQAFKVDAADTTAAGDSFIGGLCTAYANGKSIEDAMTFASAVSACAVQKKGALPSLPYIEEVQELLEKS